jgi:hypothetical protein
MPKSGESMAVVDGEEEDVMVFEDDLEVPAILRTQSSSRAGSQPSV